MYKYFLYSLYIYIHEKYVFVNKQSISMLCRWVELYIQKIMYKEFMNSNKYLHDAIKKTVNIWLYYLTPFSLINIQIVK